MATLPQTSTNQGMFVPTTVIYDAQRVLEADVNSQDFKQLIVRLYQTINTISLALNAREIGLYPNTEFVSGNLYYSNTPDPSALRTGFHKMINTGALAAGVNTIPHGITFTNNTQPSISQVFHVYGGACNTTTPVYFPMPNSNITVSVTATNIVITNSTGVIFDVSSMVVEYSKN
jgi:hypothetical protein